MGIIAEIIIGILIFLIGIILSYAISRAKSMSYKEYLDKYGYATGFIGLLIIVIIIGILRSS